MRDFLQTLNRIWSCDGINPVRGTIRHLMWQRRKLQKTFRAELRISKSKIITDNPIGVAPLVNCMGIYDFNNMNFICLLLKMINGVFLDVGANIGSYSLIASEILNSKVISIEPHPITFQSLVKNIEANKRSNIIPLNIAVTDKVTELSLLVDFFDDTKNRIIGRYSPKCSPQEIKVQGKPLDLICRELGIKPTVVKIDVEGHENEVIKGFQKESESVQLIIIENGVDIKNKKILSRMKFLGPYYVHFKNNKILTSPHRSKEDPIYVRKELISVLMNNGIEIIT